MLKLTGIMLGSDDPKTLDFYSKVLGPPTWEDGGDFWMATFEDVDGNYFQIASPMPAM